MLVSSSEWTAKTPVEGKAGNVTRTRFAEPGLLVGAYTTNVGGLNSVDTNRESGENPIPGQGQRLPRPVSVGHPESAVSPGRLFGESGHPAYRLVYVMLPEHHHTLGDSISEHTLAESDQTAVMVDRLPVGDDPPLERPTVRVLTRRGVELEGQINSHSFQEEPPR